MQQHLFQGKCFVTQRCHLCAKDRILLLEIICADCDLILAVLPHVPRAFGRQVVASSALVVFHVFTFIGNRFLLAAWPSHGGRRQGLGHQVALRYVIFQLLLLLLLKLLRGLLLLLLLLLLMLMLLQLLLSQQIPLEGESGGHGGVQVGRRRRQRAPR